MAEDEFRSFVRIHQALAQVRQIDDAVPGGRATSVWGVLEDHLRQFERHTEYPFYDAQLQSLFREFIKALHALDELYAHSNQPSGARGSGTIQLDGIEYPVFTSPLDHTAGPDFGRKRIARLRLVIDKWEAVTAFVNARHNRHARAD
jgi:hypothetical protein